MWSKQIKCTKKEDRCSDCLKLEITAQSVKQKVIQISVTVVFNEQRVDFSFGNVKFGLQGGELRLELENGEMPVKNRTLKKILERDLSVERQVGGEQERKSQVKGSVSPDLSKAGLEGVGESRYKDSRTDKFQLNIAQISHKGADHEPAWVFKNKTGESVLIGELADKLGEIDIKNIDIPLCIIATFTTEVCQIIITGLEDLFRNDILDNKRNMLELGIANLFLKRKTQPYLSQQVLYYG